MLAVVWPSFIVYHLPPTWHFLDISWPLTIQTFRLKFYEIITHCVGSLFSEFSMGIVFIAMCSARNNSRISMMYVWIVWYDDVWAYHVQLQICCLGPLIVTYHCTLQFTAFETHGYQFIVEAALNCIKYLWTLTTGSYFQFYRCMDNLQPQGRQSARADISEISFLSENSRINHIALLITFASSRYATLLRQTL